MSTFNEEGVSLHFVAVGAGHQQSLCVDHFSQGTVRYKKSHEFEIEEFSSSFVWSEVWMSLE